MNEMVLANRAADWRRLKMLVLDSVSSPITKRVYNLGLDEFFEWFGQEPRSGFNKATVSTWRVALEARGLGSISINVRITAVRKLAVEAADNGLLAPELAAGIARIKGVKSKGVRVGNWLSLRQAQTLLNTPDVSTRKGLRDRAMLAVLLGCGLRRSEVAALTLKHIQQRDSRWCIVGSRLWKMNSRLPWKKKNARFASFESRVKRSSNRRCFHSTKTSSTGCRRIFYIRESLP
jgi:site-specific recombinase XerD